MEQAKTLAEHQVQTLQPQLQQRYQNGVSEVLGFLKARIYSDTRLTTNVSDFIKALEQQYGPRAGW